MLKSLWISLRVYLFLFLLVGLVYPLVNLGIARLFFPDSYYGAFLKNAQGEVRGALQLGQKFTQPGYLWSRPSFTDYAAGGASNYGPTSAKLHLLVEQRKQQGFQNEMLFASGSGLDPHISLESGRLQTERIAAARKIDRAEVEKLLLANLKPPLWGFYGQARLNVVKVNLALDAAYPPAP